MYVFVNKCNFSGLWQANHINLTYECVTANLQVDAKSCLNHDIGNANACASNCHQSTSSMNSFSSTLCTT